MKRAFWMVAVASSLMLGLNVAWAQQAGSVSVKIDGFKGTEGVALVTLYDSAESWLKVPKAVQVPPAGLLVTV